MTRAMRAFPAPPFIPRSYPAGTGPETEVCCEVNEKRCIRVIAETDEAGKATALTLELLGLGAELASATAAGLDAVVMGSGVEEAARELARHGAGEVFYLDDPRLAAYNPELYLPPLLSLCERKPPGVILAGHTSLGQDLAPRLAFARSEERRVGTEC